MSYVIVSNFSSPHGLQRNLLQPPARTKLSSTIPDLHLMLKQVGIDIVSDYAHSSSIFNH